MFRSLSKTMPYTSREANNHTFTYKVRRSATCNCQIVDILLTYRLRTGDGMYDMQSCNSYLNYLPQGPNLRVGTVFIINRCWPSLRTLLSSSAPYTLLLQHLNLKFGLLVNSFPRHSWILLEVY